MTVPARLRVYRAATDLPSAAIEGRISMTRFTLENNEIKIAVKSQGAELASLADVKTGREYLWNGDKTYWPRQSPVLFPFVGCTRDKKYTFGGKTYPMTQHGFARDMEFELLSAAKDTLWLRLCHTKETLEIYPFPFTLDIGYALSGRSVKVLWKVHNPSDETMYFSIGAHPGFMCPINDGEAQTDCALDFHTDKDISYNLIARDGLVGIYDQKLALENGCLPMDAHLFDRDALIIEHGQTHKISLQDSHGENYVTVSFDAPLVGVWSPTGKNAPFVCIEPWYGRCDSTDFEGTLEERSYGQTLKGKETFEAYYTIEI